MGVKREASLKKYLVCSLQDEWMLTWRRGRSRSTELTSFIFSLSQSLPISVCFVPSPSLHRVPSPHCLPPCLPAFLSLLAEMSASWLARMTRNPAVSLDTNTQQVRSAVWFCSLCSSSHPRALVTGHCSHPGGYNTAWHGK